MAAPRSEHGRAREVYAATQPSGHLAWIGNDPKSSWRRWRALTETQPAGQSSLIGPDPESSSSELAQAFEPGQAARSLQALSWHAVGTSVGPEASVQVDQAASLPDAPMMPPRAAKQAADTPTVPGFSPSQAARESHVVGGAPQTESSAPPQQAAAAAHTFALKGVSHAAASLAVDPRCAIQRLFTVLHGVESSPMVAVAARLKVAGLAQRLGAAPQTETSAPPQQAAAAYHTVDFTVTPVDEETASQAAASLAAAPRSERQKRAVSAHVKTPSPKVPSLTKSASLAHGVAWAPAANATTRTRGILDITEVTRLRLCNSLEANINTQKGVV